MSSYTIRCELDCTWKVKFKVTPNSYTCTYILEMSRVGRPGILYCWTLRGSYVGSSFPPSGLSSIKSPWQIEFKVTSIFQTLITRKEQNLRHILLLTTNGKSYGGNLPITFALKRPWQVQLKVTHIWNPFISKTGRECYYCTLVDING